MCLYSWRCSLGVSTLCVHHQQGGRLGAGRTNSLFIESFGDTDTVTGISVSRVFGTARESETSYSSHKGQAGSRNIQLGQRSDDGSWTEKCCLDWHFPKSRFEREKKSPDKSRASNHRQQGIGSHRQKWPLSPLLGAFITLSTQEEAFTWTEAQVLGRASRVCYIRVPWRRTVFTVALQPHTVNVSLSWMVSFKDTATLALSQP